MPKGRDEEGFKSPMEWVRRHDEYAAASSLVPRWIKVVENAKVALNLNDQYRAYAIAQVGGVLVEETLLLLASRPQVNIEFAAI